MKNDATDAQCRAGKIIERKRDQRQFWFYPVWPPAKPSRHAALDGRRNVGEEHVWIVPSELLERGWCITLPKLDFLVRGPKLHQVGTRYDALPSGTSSYDS